MIATDENYIITEFNPMACSILGREGKNLTGQSVFSILETPEFREIIAEMAIDSAKKNRILNISRNLSVGISFSPLVDKKGYVMILRDITAWKRAEDMKREFLNILSHELRPPLSGIIGLTDIFHNDFQDQFNENQKECMRMLRESAERMRYCANESLQQTDS